MIRLLIWSSVVWPVLAIPLVGCKASPSPTEKIPTDARYFAAESPVTRAQGCYELDISGHTASGPPIFLEEFPSRFALLPVSPSEPGENLQWVLTTPQPLLPSILRIAVEATADSVMLGAAIWTHYPVELRFVIRGERLVGNAYRWSDRVSADSVVWEKGPPVRAARVPCGITGE